MRTKIAGSYLRSGRLVCPFARTAKLLVVEVELEPRRSWNTVKKATEKFAATRSKKEPSALVLVGPDIVDLDATRAWAEKCFLECAVAFAVLAGRTPIEARRDAGLEVVPWIADDEDRSRPFLDAGGCPINTFCMGPVFPVEHGQAGAPRHAPVPMFVLTWWLQVGAVPKEERLAIRADAHLRNGGPYDADALIIPCARPR